MQKKRRAWSLVAAGVVGSLVLAACGGDDTPGGSGATGTPTGGGQPTGGTYSVYIGEPEHLFPTNTSESEGGQVLEALFTGLVDYDPQTSQPRNAMAESITTTDQKTWTIKIKSGWTFHNGEPVTAQTFVDSWNFGAYSKNAQQNSQFFDKIEGYADLQGDAEAKPPKEPKAKTMTGLKVVDDTTLTVTLTQPFSQFSMIIGYTAFYPMPKAALGNEAAQKKFEEAPIGNGPYQMDGKWVHDESIKVKRYEGYKGERPNADTIEFRIFKDINTAYNELKAGTLDIMDSVPPEKIKEAEREFGNRFITRDSSTFQYLGFPLYDQKFQNKKLRQAFSMAINRQEIVEKIFSNTRIPAASVVSPVVVGSRKDACKYCKFDPAQAKQLLQEAGGWSGTLTLWYNSGAGHEKWVEAVANQLRTNLGITDIKYQSLDFAQYLPKLDKKEITGPFRLGWGMDYPSPQNYLEPLYGSKGSSNSAFYSNADVDRLISEGNQAKSLQEGIAKYQQAEDIILEDLPVIPMFFSRVTGGHSENVDNVVIDAFGRIRLGEVRVKKA